MAGTSRSGRPAEKLDPNLQAPKLCADDEDDRLALAFQWVFESTVAGKIPPRHADALAGILKGAAGHLKARKKVDEVLDLLEQRLQELETRGIAREVADRQHLDG